MNFVEDESHASVVDRHIIVSFVLWELLISSDIYLTELRIALF